MKCPNCNYSDGYDFEINKRIEGEFGEFFELSNGVEMIRDDRGSYIREFERTNVYGCPKCKILFME